MRDFQEYIPENAIEENLKELAARGDLLTEQEYVHLRELALELTDGYDGHSNWLESLPDSSISPFLGSSSPVKSIHEAIVQAARLRAMRQSLFLCKELGRCLEEKDLLSPTFFFPELDPIAQRSQRRVACQRSNFVDEAYLCFAKHLNDPRISYTHSFMAACEDVYNGVCDFCILPIESSAEGHLNSFFKLIERYELKTVMTCDISENGTDKSTRYALLGRRMGLASLLEGEHFFAFSIPFGQSPSPAELLTAAESFGLRLYRIDSFSSGGSHRFSVRITLQAEGIELYPFLLFLAMVAPHYEPIGIYPHIVE